MAENPQKKKKKFWGRPGIAKIPYKTEGFFFGGQDPLKIEGFGSRKKSPPDNYSSKKKKRKFSIGQNPLSNISASALFLNIESKSTHFLFSFASVML